MTPDPLPPLHCARRRCDTARRAPARTARPRRRRAGIGGLAVLAALAPWSSPALDQVWLVGGGYDPASSQAQIEQNVLWARRVVQGLPGERRVLVYFTDGSEPGRDVREWQRPAETPETLQPLARVMGYELENGERYRDHAIPGVAGSTGAGTLGPALGAALRGMRSGERFLLVFNGHGSHDPSTPSANAIWLWNQTSMTAEELARVLDEAPQGVLVRFVLTQCFAGGFARLARVDGSRCGFMAEGADRQAEGCHASVDASEYRDYSTYFFAALGNRARDGGPVAYPPDLDADGQVSLREAHLYALRTARSADLPRSTSEEFLLGWLPWYFGWARWAVPLPWENEYAALARDLARAQGLPSGLRLAGTLRERRRAIELESDALAREQTALEAATEETRARLEADLLRRWPEVGAPYTQAFKHFLESELASAQATILAHPDYPALVRDQERLRDLDARLLDLERDLAALERIEHVALLGRVRGLFDHLAPESDRRVYDALLACEGSRL
jgi:hypothetical protein